MWVMNLGAPFLFARCRLSLFEQYHAFLRDAADTAAIAKAPGFSIDAHFELVGHPRAARLLLSRQQLRVADTGQVVARYHARRRGQCRSLEFITGHCRPKMVICVMWRYDRGRRHIIYYIFISRHATLLCCLTRLLALGASA